ncbi:PEBB factor, partial [Polypterus senegalus]
MEDGSSVLQPCSVPSWDAAGRRGIFIFPVATKYSSVTRMEKQKYFRAEEKHKSSSDAEVLWSHMDRRTRALPGQGLFKGLVENLQAEPELGGRVTELLGVEDCICHEDALAQQAFEEARRRTRDFEDRDRSHREDLEARRQTDPSPGTNMTGGDDMKLR